MYMYICIYMCVYMYIYITIFQCWNQVHLLRLRRQRELRFRFLHRRLGAFLFAYRRYYKR